MKRLHRRDLFGWSSFNERLDIDFNGVLWVRPGDNVLVDPPPLSAHDRAHLEKLGGASWIVITTSAHLRGAEDIRSAFGAKVAGPLAEKDVLPFACDHWLTEGDSLGAGLRVYALAGSKTPGELALWLEPDTLILGDLVRSHRAGELSLLSPEQGLQDSRRARESVARLAELPATAVLVGDGFCVFRDGQRALKELLGR